MTYKKWYSLYKAYKNNFDLETTMKEKKLRFMDLEQETTLDDLIPF